MYQSALDLIDSGKIDQAIQILKRCVEISLDSTNALLTLARLYVTSSQLSNALESYSQARTVEQFKSKSIAGIAEVHRLQGHAEYAYQFIQKELSSNKPCISIVLSLSDICLELGRYPEAIKAIEDLLNISTAIPVYKKKNLLHTPGKLYDKDKKYDKAFHYHKAANELTSSQYNRLQFQQRISNIQSVYSNTFPKSCNLSTIKNNQPVFIIGMPRSGTTLIEQILSCHTQIHAAGELLTVQQLVAGMCKGQYPKQMQNISPQTLSNSAQFYIDKECSKRHKYTTDKMPHNYLYLGVIHQLFPNSKIINIKRNPIDTCLSIYFQYFNDTHRYATNLSNIAHHYAGYNNLINHWKKQFPENIITVNYEDIINHTQQETTRILEFLDLKWQDRCLEHYKSKRHVLTASQQQVNKPIYNKSIDRWKSYKPYIKPLLSELKSFDLI